MLMKKSEGRVPLYFILYYEKNWNSIFLHYFFFSFFFCLFVVCVFEFYVFPVCMHYFINLPILASLGLLSIPFSHINKYSWYSYAWMNIPQEKERVKKTWWRFPWVSKSEHSETKSHSWKAEVWHCETC